MSNSPEETSFSPEHKRDSKALEQTGAERREALRNIHEKVNEQSPEKNVEGARHEALEQATKIDHERQQHETVDRQPSPAERRKDGPIGKVEREASFTATMSEVQSQMSAPSRAFSKVIHTKAVETVSDAAANTIARPNALLSGAVFAFILTLTVYLVAKNLGYPLSGFETIAAFTLGWILGLVYDFLKVMITGRK
jgi:hypothetical protein